MMGWIRRFLRNRGSRGGSALFIGTIVAQLINLATMPILTRLYDPAAFGYLALVVSTVGLIAPVAALRLESVLLLPASIRAASAALGLALITSFITSVLATVILQVCFSFGLLPDLALLPGFSLWVGGLVLLTSTFSVLSQFVLRERAYAAVARRNIYQVAGTGITQVLLSTVPGGSLGLIAGYTLGRFVGLTPLALQSRRSWERFARVDVREIVKEYWRFPVLFAPAAALNAVGLAAPTLFVGIWYSIADAGQWSVANQILALPIVLLATAAGQIIEAELAIKLRTSSGSLTRYYLRQSGLLGSAALLLILGVAVLAPTVIPVFLGPGWETATSVMLILVFMTAMRLVASPLKKALTVLQMAKLNLVLDIGRVLLLGIALGIVVNRNLDLLEAAVFISIALAVNYLMTWIAGLWAVLKYDRSAR